MKCLTRSSASTTCTTASSSSSRVMMLSLLVSLSRSLCARHTLIRCTSPICAPILRNGNAVSPRASCTSARTSHSSSGCAPYREQCSLVTRTSCAFTGDSVRMCPPIARQLAAARCAIIALSGPCAPTRWAPWACVGAAGRLSQTIPPSVRACCHRLAFTPPPRWTSGVAPEQLRSAAGPRLRPLVPTSSQVRPSHAWPLRLPRRRHAA
mmetsp:Transcript_4296/g.11138  ORF Transcript_4296/g.11138 Transcript_4296/m.11138 type:complete len:209 (-) Transcript_4296:201-827(-)